MNKNIIKAAWVKSIPVMTGYIPLGIGFGILLEKNGYGVWWSLAMGLFIFAGSMQYVGVGLLASGASFLTTALTTLMVNARHLFYGISMAEKYKGAGKKKPYLIFALTDETYSLVVSDDGPDKENPYMFWFLISLFNQIYWVVGNVIGSLLGSVIPFRTDGIEFVMTALFVTVVVEQWENTKNHFPALTGFLASLACLLLFGPDQFLIPSMILITLVLTLGRNAAEKKEEE